MSRPVAALIALIAALTLVTGCGEAAEKASEEQIEEAAEAQGDDVDVDIEDDEITVEGEDGSVTMGGKLPEGFPEDDVPLVDGDVVVAMGAEGEGFQVNLAVDGEPEAVFDEAVGLLEDAGFATEDETAVGAMSASLTSPKYTVSVLASGASGATTVSYVVEVE